jgi:SAM-dependent methyltransferase
VTRSYREVNREAWAALVRHGCEWTRPYGPQEFSRARELLDPRGWIPWDEVESVLCVACGGGQQGPLFASLKRRVTLLDLSSAQLERDREVARRYGFAIELIERDMLDLVPLHGRDFDLVYQSVSAVYAPDVRRLYREVARALRPGGYYYVVHWNPVYTQLPELGEWDGEAYRIVHPQQPGVVVPQTRWRVNEQDFPITSWEYIHPLDDLLGGLCDAGFVIVHFAETSRGDLSAAPGSPAHLAGYLPATFAVFAQLRVENGPLAQRTDT